MTEFLEEVGKPLAAFWKTFGLAVGIERDVLESTERKYSTRDSSNLSFAFAEIFSIWEKKRGEGYKPCTWATIYTILKEELQCFEFANKIEKKFLSHERENADRSDGSGYSSLPNQTFPGQLNSFSSPNSLSDALSLQQDSFVTSTNVLPSPEFPFSAAEIQRTKTEPTAGIQKPQSLTEYPSTQIPRGSSTVLHPSLYGSTLQSEQPRLLIENNIPTNHQQSEFMFREFPLISGHQPHVHPPFPPGYASEGANPSHCLQLPDTMVIPTTSSSSTGTTTCNNNMKTEQQIHSQLLLMSDHVSEESSEESYHSATDSIKKVHV